VSAITGAYDVRKDANLDGSVDFFDITHASNMAGGGGYVTTGRGVLGSPDNANRFGYGAYLRDPAVPQWHVRHRVFRSDIGRWLTRDPAGYVDGLSLYEYSASRSILGIDPDGLQMQPFPGLDGGPGLAPPQVPGWTSAPPTPDDIEKMLDVAGCAPVIGECADLLNALINLQQGDNTGAIFCMAAMLPGGDLLKLRKLKNLEKQFKSLRKQAENHREKLNRFIVDPDSMDNLGLLVDKTIEQRLRIIEQRIKSLEDQISHFEREARKKFQELLELMD